MKSKQFKTGFTIVEIIIIVVVIAVIAAVATVSYQALIGDTRDKSVIADAKSVSDEIEVYGLSSSGVYGPAINWYSGGSPNSNIKHKPSNGNVVDVVSTNSDYCVRVYNPQSSTYRTIHSAHKNGPTKDSCVLIGASAAAGGQAGSLAGWWKFNGDVRVYSYALNAEAIDSIFRDGAY